MTILNWAMVAIAAIGAIVGVTGWFSGRDKKISADGEWRGVVNTKLDTIGTAIVSVSCDIKGVQNTLDDHGKILTMHGTTIANHEIRLVDAERRISKRKIQPLE